MTLFGVFFTGHLFYLTTFVRLSFVVLQWHTYNEALCVTLNIIVYLTTAGFCNALENYLKKN